MPKISALTAGTTPTGVETLPAVQSGATTNLTINQIYNTINATRSIPLASFGVVANGGTNDTAAVNAAIAYANANSGGITFIVPIGRTIVTSNLTPITVNSVFFKGAGNAEICQIGFTGGVTSLFQWGTLATFVTFGGMDNVGLVSLSGTSGHIGLYLPNSSGLFFTNMYTFQIDQLAVMGTATTGIASSITFSNIQGGCIDSVNPLFDCVQGAGLYLFNSLFATSSLAPSVGRGAIRAKDKSWDTMIISGNGFTFFDYAVLLSAPNGTVLGNVFFDMNVVAEVTRGITSTSVAGGGVNQVRISNSWINGATRTPTTTVNGVLITGQGGSGHSIEHCIILQFRKEAIKVDAVVMEALSIDNVQCTYNNYNNDGFNVIDIAGGAIYIGIAVTNCYISPDQAQGHLAPIGLNIRAACDQLRVLNNDFTTSTLPYDGMALGTTNTFAHTKYKQFGNVGLTDASLHSLGLLKGTAIPAGGTAGAGITLSSTANFGVFFGSSAPTLSAAKGSLYLRSDGTGVNDRAYINTNGATTWTAIVTVA